MGSGRYSRRSFLVRSLMGTVALWATPVFSRTIVDGVPWSPGSSDVPPAYSNLRFFTEAERRCIDAITARLIPSDATGVGARDADVVDFIDSQLAGFYGQGERWYMRGPFADGLETQGYQSEHPPAGLYRAGIDALDSTCRDAHGDAFAQLPEELQDEILTRLDKGELELDGVSAKAFFDLVLENAIEGFFCDPIYGGNRNMVGWKLVGFPGARYDYRNFLDHNGAKILIEPVGLKGRPAWTPA